MARGQHAGWPFQSVHYSPPSERPASFLEAVLRCHEDQKVTYQKVTSLQPDMLPALVLVCAVGAALLSFSSSAEDAAASDGAADGAAGGANGAREWHQRCQTMMDALLGAIAGLLISTLTRSNAVADALLGV